MSTVEMGDAYRKMQEMSQELNTLKKPTLSQENTSATVQPSTTQYKYNEDQFAKDMMAHVNKTYVTHYGGVIQPVEFIMSNSSNLDYLRGNVIKYIYRFGSKNGNNPEDLYKACHYLMMMLKYSKE